jgi:hypothetical protein
LIIIDPTTGSEFFIEGIQAQAPGLEFALRLASPPEFADINPSSG